MKKKRIKKEIKVPVQEPVIHPESKALLPPQPPKATDQGPVLYLDAIELMLSALQSETGYTREEIIESTQFGLLTDSASLFGGATQRTIFNYEQVKYRK